MKNNKEKYYIVKNKALATTLGYVLNRVYYTYDDPLKGGKMYSFVDDEKFREAFKLIMDYRDSNLDK